MINSLRSLLIASCALTACSKEPDVTPSDLPRVPPKAPAEALQVFQIKEGFKVELVAAEPLVVDPIAICFDEQARMFVIEMRDYSERRDERLGRVKLLRDTDGDGRMDEASIFADGLPWPTALFYSNGGLFVGSSPDILFFKDTDGDGKADERRVVFTGFGAQTSRLNVQQLLNSFTWGLDNRIHGANGGNGGMIASPEHPGRPAVSLRNNDFSFDPRSLDFRLESGGGQYGLTFDDAGRKFVCSNSSHIRQVLYQHRDVKADMLYPLPPPSIDIAADGPAAEVFRISPDEPWRVIRTKWRVAGLVSGPIEGGGRASGYFTGATGVTIYRGDALGQDVTGDAFIADIGSNLVHRKKLRRTGVPFTAARPEDEKDREFLASSDNWFRPTQFATGPDGALYVSDIYRETIEHPWSIPPNLKKHLDLNSGNDRGRIYRIVPGNFKQPALPKLASASTAELIRALSHPNGWVRDTATRLLYQRGDKKRVGLARKALQGSPTVKETIHLLSVLQGAGALQAQDLLPALRHGTDDLKEFALRFCEYVQPTPELLAQMGAMADDKSPAVRHELAWAASRFTFPKKAALIARLLHAAETDWERHALLAAASEDPLSVYAIMAQEPRPVAKNIADPLAAMVARKTKTSATPAKPASSGAVNMDPVQRAPASNRADTVARFASALDLRGDGPKGKAIYEQRCASCHRLYGQGTPVGPDLESVRAAGKEALLISILDPNREVPPRFATFAVQTRDGEEHTGVLANEAANGVMLRQASGVEIFVPRADIAAMNSSQRSLMPEGLEEGLSPQDMANLLAYILSE